MDKFSEIKENELENINAGGAVSTILTAINVYDIITDFSKGFAKGMTKPE